jgi:hypothetical protein
MCQWLWMTAWAVILKWYLLTEFLKNAVWGLNFRSGDSDKHCLLQWDALYPVQLYGFTLWYNFYRPRTAAERSCLQNSASPLAKEKLDFCHKGYSTVLRVTPTHKLEVPRTCFVYIPDCYWQSSFSPSHLKPASLSQSILCRAGLLHPVVLQRDEVRGTLTNETYLPSGRPPLHFNIHLEVPLPGFPFHPLCICRFEPMQKYGDNAGFAVRAINT